MEQYIVILFYKFVTIENPGALRVVQLVLATRLGLKGRVIIAQEGINATLEGTAEAIAEYKRELLTDPRFADVVIKESEGTGRAFPKLAVKVRDEIVTLKAGEFDVPNQTATELSAEELEKWYEEGEDFVVLDLRNDYEIESGAFERTVNPKLRNFRDLPAKLPELEDLKTKKVVAVCTGGIRCTKATCLLKEKGFKQVYQLKDGIHTYLAKYPGKNFKGSLFVFDNRMTTPVVETPHREIIGRCTFCHVPTEQYANDDSARPTIKLLCCEACFQVRATQLRPAVSGARLA